MQNPQPLHKSVSTGCDAIASCHLPHLHCFANSHLPLGTRLAGLGIQLSPLCLGALLLPCQVPASAVVVLVQIVALQQLDEQLKEVIQVPASVVTVMEVEVGVRPWHWQCTRATPFWLVAYSRSLV